MLIISFNSQIEKRHANTYSKPEIRKKIAGVLGISFAHSDIHYFLHNDPKRTDSGF
jgi:hypothetical protein